MEKEVIYLTNEEIQEMRKDIEFIQESKSWDDLDKIYDKYSDKFSGPLVEFFGEYVTDLEHEIWQNEFWSDEDTFLRTFEYRPKYIVLGGFAHWAYLQMEKLEK